jgi:hypothetical protein
LIPSGTLLMVPGMKARFVALNVAVAAATLVSASAFAIVIKRPPRVLACSDYQQTQPTCIASQIVTTGAQLKSVLGSGFVGCVQIPRDSDIDVTGMPGMQINSGVSIIGERGDLCSRPTIRYSARSDVGSINVFNIVGNDTIIQGIRFVGPENDDRTPVVSKKNDYVNCFQIVEDADNQLGRRIVIEDNEFTEWIGSSVDITSTHVVADPADYSSKWGSFSAKEADEVRVVHNFMHHNSTDGGGYGVTVGGGAYALIEGNVFDFNRHSVASDGFSHSGYIAQFNYVLEGGFQQCEDGFFGDSCFYNQHFDVHGTKDHGYGGGAGEFYQVARNAIRGKQDYYQGLKQRPSWLIRGKPAIGAEFDANIDVHDDLDSAVSLKMAKSDTGIGEDEAAFNFTSAGNSFHTDHSREFATGDFNGDGRTDVFVATGTAWFYSPSAIAPWVFLHISDKLVNELGFADINNDGVTDILYRDTVGNVGWLQSGRVPLVNFTTSPVAMADMRFGDFDADGKTDIFYTKNNLWNIWYGATQLWTVVNASGFAVDEYLFGDFDSVPGTDVAMTLNTGWSISSGATSGWIRINDELSVTFHGVVAADFDGDGYTDIAIDSAEIGDASWLVSYGGRKPFVVLRDAMQGQFSLVRNGVIGRFDGDKAVEVVSFDTPPGEYNSNSNYNFFSIWRGETVGQQAKRQSLWEMR